MQRAIDEAALRKGWFAGPDEIASLVEILFPERLEEERVLAQLSTPEDPDQETIVVTGKKSGSGSRDARAHPRAAARGTGPGRRGRRLRTPGQEARPGPEEEGRSRPPAERSGRRHRAEPGGGRKTSAAPRRRWGRRRGRRIAPAVTTPPPRRGRVGQAEGAPAHGARDPRRPPAPLVVRRAWRTTRAR